MCTHFPVHKRVYTNEYPFVYVRRGVLYSVNFGCFVSSGCQHFHCDALRTSVRACVNWHKIQQMEHTPGLCRNRTSVYNCTGRVVEYCANQNVTPVHTIWYLAFNLFLNNQQHKIEISVKYLFGFS